MKRRILSSFTLAALSAMVMPVQAQYSIKHGCKGLASAYKLEPLTSLAMLGLMGAGVAGARYLYNNGMPSQNSANQQIIQDIYDILKSATAGCVRRAQEKASALLELTAKDKDNKARILSQIGAYRTFPVRDKESREKKRQEILRLKDELYPVPHHRFLAGCGIAAGLFSLWAHVITFNEGARKPDYTNFLP